MERLLVVEYKEKEVKDIFREERVERIWVDSEVAVVFVEATTEGNKAFFCGGGGGSFNIGANQLNECCYNCDERDKVTITFLQ